MEPRRLSGVQVPAPFRLEDDQIVADLPHARAVFSTARGGVSSGPYDSLNLGMLDRGRQGERRREPAPARRARRPPVAALLLRPPGPRQPRAGGRPSRRRPRVRTPRRTARRPRSTTRPRSSSSPTACRSCSPRDGAVAALHGGWRAAGGRASSTRAWRRCARSAARARSPPRSARAPAAAATRSPTRCMRSSRPTTRGAARTSTSPRSPAQQLEAHGIEVHDVGLCTICSERGTLFSHRRDQGVTGRQAGVVCRT